MSYGTFTSTFTVVDIRKAFEGFEADLRMIARRTEKWTQSYVEDVFHDIIKLAESKYLRRVSISLQDADGVVIQATRFTVNDSGTAISGARAGGNDWPCQPNTSLTVTLEYTSAWFSLSEDARTSFRRNNSFKINWSPSSLNTEFPHLAKQSAQTYASNGYQLEKDNFK
ncbi:HORMA-1 domain-containing protein [Flaviaesturariibacter terrae]